MPQTTIIKKRKTMSSYSYGIGNDEHEQEHVHERVHDHEHQHQHEHAQEQQEHDHNRNISSEQWQRSTRSRHDRNSNSNNNEYQCRKKVWKQIVQHLSEEIHVARVAKRYEKDLYQNATSSTEYMDERTLRERVMKLLYSDSPITLMSELFDHLQQWQEQPQQKSQHLLTTVRTATPPPPLLEHQQSQQQNPFFLSSSSFSQPLSPTIQQQQQQQKQHKQKHQTIATHFSSNDNTVQSNIAVHDASVILHNNQHSASTISPRLTLTPTATTRKVAFASSHLDYPHPMPTLLETNDEINSIQDSLSQHASPNSFRIDTYNQDINGTSLTSDNSSNVPAGAGVVEGHLVTPPPPVYASSEATMAERMFPPPNRTGRSSDYYRPKSSPYDTNSFCTTSLLPPRVPFSSSTSLPLPSKTGIERKQQRLLELHHAATCTNTGSNNLSSSSVCQVSLHCMEMKLLWAHMSTCTNSRCGVRHCSSSRMILAHYKKCTNTRCPVCIPVKQQIARLATGATATNASNTDTKNQLSSKINDEAFTDKDQKTFKNDPRTKKSVPDNHQYNTIHSFLGSLQPPIADVTDGNDGLEGIDHSVGIGTIHYTQLYRNNDQSALLAPSHEKLTTNTGSSSRASTSGCPSPVSYVSTSSTSNQTLLVASATPIGIGFHDPTIVATTQDEESGALCVNDAHDAHDAHDLEDDDDDNSKDHTNRMQHHNDQQHHNIVELEPSLQSSSQLRSNDDGDKYEKVEANSGDTTACGQMLAEPTGGVSVASTAFTFAATTETPLLHQIPSIMVDSTIGHNNQSSSMPPLLLSTSTSSSSSGAASSGSNPTYIEAE